MPRSSLAVKVGIAEIVERLNDDECVDVIRLLQYELGHKTINSMLHQIIMQLTQRVTHESLIKIEKTIKDKYCQHFARKKAATTEQNQDITTEELVVFPLHRLPSDLILKTSLFLNEKDIFHFEQCCRLFYKMINNTSYLNKCNNFKQFTMTKERLNQMKQDKYSFIKYSKAKQLMLDLYTDDYGSLHEYNQTTLQVAGINDFETTIHQMKRVGSHDNWWTSLCKSISILDTYMGVLLSVMPIDILFNPDPNESSLQKIELGLCDFSDSENTWNKYMNKFEQEYLQYQKRLERQGLKIRSLKCVKHTQQLIFDTPATINPCYIHAKHVCLSGMKVDLTDDKFLTNECNPGMKILSIDGGIEFITNNDGKSINLNINRGLEIETMRLVSLYTRFGCPICNKKVVIDSLNLQNSLKNLTIEFGICFDKKFNTEIQTFENVFKKKYCYNLKNVNIIIPIDKNKSIDWFFQLLKENQAILKHQFKQLNIAIVKWDENENEALYFVLEWNNKMNDKSLNQEKTQLSGMNHGDPNQKQFKDKYLFMRTQWLD